MNAHNYFFKDFDLYFNEWIIENFQGNSKIIFEGVETNDCYELDIIEILKLSGKYKELLRFYKMNVLTLKSAIDYEFTSNEQMIIDTFEKSY